MNWDTGSFKRRIWRSDGLTFHGVVGALPNIWKAHVAQAWTVFQIWKQLPEISIGKDNVQEHSFDKGQQQDG